MVKLVFSCLQLIAAHDLVIDKKRVYVRQRQIYVRTAQRECYCAARITILNNRDRYICCIRRRDPYLIRYLIILEFDQLVDEFREFDQARSINRELIFDTKQRLKQNCYNVDSQ